MSCRPNSLTRPNFCCSECADRVLVTIQSQRWRTAERFRYANMRRIILIALLGTSSLLVLGCPARWKVVFINGSGQSLSVQLPGALDGKRRAFTLSEGGSHSEFLGQVQRLAVFAPSGRLLFEQDDFGKKDLAPPLAGNYPHTYILLTTTNAYGVLPEYRKTWREHIDEITRPGGITRRLHLTAARAFRSAAQCGSRILSALHLPPRRR